ncbi:MAG: B12-binding domain-containing protein [Firmicutes bacterium]|nr:B12-binding domain-containing protein [Bacillota bacterium]
MADVQELLERAATAVVNADAEEAEKVARQTLEAGIDPLLVINEGFSRGMAKAGELFERGELFLPELIIASEGMVSAIRILEAVLPVQEKKAGVAVVGTIEGDIHDIGKGIVATMLRVYGFEVHDLGRDVSIKKFVETVRVVKPDIVGSSALMTTTQTGQKILEQELQKAGLRDSVKTMVGGAVVTQRWANKIGADAYGENAMEAVAKAKELLGLTT